MNKVARSSSNESDFIYYVSNGFSGLDQLLAQTSPEL